MVEPALVMDKRKDPPELNGSKGYVAKRKKSEKEESSSLSVGAKEQTDLITGAQRTSGLRAPIIQLQGHSVSFPRGIFIIL